MIRIIKLTGLLIAGAGLMVGFCAIAATLAFLYQINPGASSSASVESRITATAPPAIEVPVKGPSPIPPATNATGEGDSLNREFETFLAEQGESMAQLSALTPPVDPPKQKQTGDRELPRAATQQLEEEYRISHAKRKGDHEVWIKLDPEEARGLSLDELSAKAAELYSDGIDPIKIVVWVGRRPQVVRTFNGPQMF